MRNACTETPGAPLGCGNGYAEVATRTSTSTSLFSGRAGAGLSLQKLRKRLGLTARDVEELSRRFADEQNNREFAISRSRLIQIETERSTPSIYKLFSLSAVYSCSISELLELYIDTNNIACRILDYCGTPASRLLRFQVHPGRWPDKMLRDETGVLSEPAGNWGTIPMLFFNSAHVRGLRYGFIGLEDYTMFPLLRPGSLVQIDTRDREISSSVHKNELDRPMYFLETHERYICSWCELDDNRLISIAHPLSGTRIREFAFPDEAEVIGRVTGIAVQLRESRETQARPDWRAPNQARHTVRSRLSRHEKSGCGLINGGGMDSRACRESARSPVATDV